MCPIAEENDVKGIGIFNVNKTELAKIMDKDLGVKAGLFTYQLLSCRTFPGDALAGEIQVLTFLSRSETQGILPLSSRPMGL